jgi:hypothetical protein
MTSVDVRAQPIPTRLTELDDDERVASITRLKELFSDGAISYGRFAGVLDQVFAASDRAELQGAMVGLPPLVRLTPASLRLRMPLIVRAAEGGLRFGPGWQLAADTTVSTGVGTTRVDLTRASWDSEDINLRLGTWGSIEVLVPKGVAVQLAGGSRPVELQSILPAVPGGPVLRVSTFGPAGTIRISQIEVHDTGRANGKGRMRRVSRNR